MNAPGVTGPLCNLCAGLSAVAASCMELVRQTADPADQLLMAGTASDHFALGWAHIWRGVRLSLGCSQSASAVHTKSSNIYDGKKGFQVATQGEEENPLSDDYLPDDQVHLPKNGVFLPTQPWKESWDMLVLVMIMYSAIMVPFRICFDAEAVGYMFFFEHFVTFVFITDVLFNFNTAYLDDTRWVISRPRIAVTYLQGWFWIDVPSSVPVELIDMFVEGDNDHLAMLRFLRLFRLLRLLRLLKVRLRLLRCFVIALIARASHPTTHDCCTDLRLLRPLALRTVSLRWENTLQRLRSNLTST